MFLVSNTNMGLCLYITYDHVWSGKGILFLYLIDVSVWLFPKFFVKVEFSLSCWRLTKYINHKEMGKKHFPITNLVVSTVMFGSFFDAFRIVDYVPTVETTNLSLPFWIYIFDKTCWKKFHVHCTYTSYRKTKTRPDTINFKMNRLIPIVFKWRLFIPGHLVS